MPPGGRPRRRSNEFCHAAVFNRFNADSVRNPASPRNRKRLLPARAHSAPECGVHPLSCTLVQVAESTGRYLLPHALLESRSSGAPPCVV